MVELAEGGRVLTFRNFDVDPGAGGLKVYMTAGVPESDGDVKDFVELAPLKGTKGNQQYKLPESLDLKRYGTVVICACRSPPASPRRRCASRCSHVPVHGHAGHDRALAVGHLHLDGELDPAVGVQRVEQLLLGPASFPVAVIGPFASLR